MNDQANHPYAAPQAPPEKKAPVPWSVYRRAGIAGTTAFVVGFVLAVPLAGLAFAVAHGYGSLAEVWGEARYEVLTCSFLIGAILADGAARRVLRQRTVRD